MIVILIWVDVSSTQFTIRYSKRGTKQETMHGMHYLYILKCQSEQQCDQLYFCYQLGRTLGLLWCSFLLNVHLLLKNNNNNKWAKIWVIQVLCLLCLSQFNKRIYLYKNMSACVVQIVLWEFSLCNMLNLLTVNAEWNTEYLKKNLRGQHPIAKTH